MGVVLAPSKIVMGQLTQRTQQKIGMIEDVARNTGILPLAQNDFNSVGGFLGGVVDTGENILNKGSDSIFGIFDVLKYISYAVIGFAGLLALKFGKDIISEIGQTPCRR